MQKILCVLSFFRT